MTKVVFFSDRTFKPTYAGSSSLHLTETIRNYEQKSVRAIAGASKFSWHRPHVIMSMGAWRWQIIATRASWMSWHLLGSSSQLLPAATVKLPATVSEWKNSSCFYVARCYLTNNAVCVPVLKYIRWVQDGPFYFCIFINYIQDYSCVLWLDILMQT